MCNHAKGQTQDFFVHWEGEVWRNLLSCQKEVAHSMCWLMAVVFVYVFCLGLGFLADPTNPFLSNQWKPDLCELLFLSQKDQSFLVPSKSAK